MTEEARPARHPDPTLLGLAKLNATMNDSATESERRSWWQIVQRTQSSMDEDARAAKADHDAIRRLRDGVTDVYSALNGGLYPDYSGAGERSPECSAFSKPAPPGSTAILSAEVSRFTGDLSFATDVRRILLTARPDGSMAPAAPGRRPPPAQPSRERSAYRSAYDRRRSLGALNRVRSHSTRETRRAEPG